MSRSWNTGTKARLGIRAITGMLGTVGAVLVVFGSVAWLFWLGVVMLSVAVLLGFLDGYKGMSEQGN